MVLRNKLLNCHLFMWGFYYQVKEVDAIKIPIFNIFLHSRSKLPRIEGNLLKIPVTATILPTVMLIMLIMMMIYIQGDFFSTKKLI